MDKPCKIQKFEMVSDEIGNQIKQVVWTFDTFCTVNGLSGKEVIANGNIKAEKVKTFETRYCKVLSDLREEGTQILYDGGVYDVINIDDYMERHEKLKMTAVRRDERI